MTAALSVLLLAPVLASAGAERSAPHGGSVRPQATPVTNVQPLLPSALPIPAAIAGAPMAAAPEPAGPQAQASPEAARAEASRRFDGDAPLSAPEAAVPAAAVPMPAVFELAGEKTRWLARAGGALYAATSAGLRRRTSQGWSAPLPGRVERVVETGGRVYAATMGGLFRQDGEDWTLIREGSTGDALESGGRLYVAAWDGLFSAEASGGPFLRESVERYYYPQNRIFEADGGLYVEGFSGVRRRVKNAWNTSWAKRPGREQRLFELEGRLYGVIGERLLRADARKWEPIFWGGGAIRGASSIAGAWHVGTDTGLWVREPTGWKRAVSVPMADAVEHQGRVFARADASQQRGLYEREAGGWKMTLASGVNALGAVGGRLFAAADDGLWTLEPEGWRRALPWAGPVSELPLLDGEHYVLATSAGVARWAR